MLILDPEEQAEFEELFKPVVTEIEKLVKERFASTSPVDQQNTTNYIDYAINVFSVSIFNLFNLMTRACVETEPREHLMEYANNFLRHLKEGITGNIETTLEAKRIH